MDKLNSLQPLNFDTPSPKSRSVDVKSTSGNDQAGVNMSVEKQPRQSDATSTKQVIDSQDISNSDLDELMSSLNDNLQVLQSYLMFEKDEDTEKMVFFIKNSETNEVLRQVPSQELLAISKNISNYLEMVNQSSRESLPPVGLLTDQVV